MIWKCVDDAQLASDAQQLCQTLAQGPTKAYGLMKQALYASSGNGLAEQLALEARLQRDAGKSHDFQEGVTAFLDKRPAKFSGA